MRDVTPPAHVDVLIVGAGISGIGCGCHLRREAPEKTFAILESRDGIGGTWDLFRYPGIRSDSDLQTFGYQFKPWTRERVIAPADEILDYLRETVAEYNLSEEMHFGYQVLGANFDSDRARWTVQVRHRDGEELELTCSVLFAATGYYNYEQGYLPPFPGVEEFAGTLVHPQHWPEDLDYAGKRVVVIGSGATAVTLVPAMAKTAAHVTMLQRSPTYVISLPSEDPIIAGLKRVMSEQRAFRIARALNIKRQAIFYTLCQRQPALMRTIIRAQTKAQLPKHYPVDVHFKPRYNPWDERLCVVPDGDLFRALRHGDASIVTDQIDTFTPDGIRLRSGSLLPADIVVAATGLNVFLFGGVSLSVDGTPVDPADTVAYRAMLLSNIPNFAFSIGYTNASWTLKVDLVCEHLCRLLHHLDATGTDTFTPVPDRPLQLRPLLDFQAGYVQRGVAQFPKQGSEEPWTIAMSYAADRRRLIDTPVTDPALRFGRAATPAEVVS
ncbi:NAD(P)/FAD-dependent oxidoreductase [Conexibacter sp. DBS9H8]|uniref:flavin-containing monooxygenase n=1 Tax=Conexibacter sp. DBS9H8 TaxID=2937801 RepID=UPI002010446F|nr:NAD(P)/FAD-dependent oxidoreductase [Conexibacter sp. DBS9H8]